MRPATGGRQGHDAPSGFDPGRTGRQHCTCEGSPEKGTWINDPFPLPEKNATCRASTAEGVNRDGEKNSGAGQMVLFSGMRFHSQESGKLLERIP